MLNPRSAEDRRITAFTRTFAVSTFPDGSILRGTYSYDCWGDKQGGLFKSRVTPHLFSQLRGTKSYLTLGLMRMGCCPPQLMKGFIEQEGMPVDERDPVEEAMLLHKRGYFGGGG